MFKGIKKAVIIKKIEEMPTEITAQSVKDVFEKIGSSYADMLTAVANVAKENPDEIADLIVATLAIKKSVEKQFKIVEKNMDENLKEPPTSLKEASKAWKEWI